MESPRYGILRHFHRRSRQYTGYILPTSNFKPRRVFIELTSTSCSRRRSSHYYRKYYHTLPSAFNEETSQQPLLQPLLHHEVVTEDRSEEGAADFKRMLKKCPSEKYNGLKIFLTPHTFSRDSTI
jgi:hypothetical protein